MHRQTIQLGICLAVLAASAAAQTVTDSGTTNTVPVFTGTSTIRNSPISVLGGNVGIGTTTPQGMLDANGRVGAQSFKVASSFTDLVNNAPWYGIGDVGTLLPGSQGNGDITLCIAKGHTAK